MEEQISKSTDGALDNLLHEHSVYAAPIKVNFRELVSWVRYGERSTHMIHPYPAKLLTHIPHFFLQNNILSQRNDLVMDPFCGSGTVPLESILAGRQAIGFDSNPLAHFIANVKVTPINPARIKRSLNNVTRRYKGISPLIPDVINLDYWFSEKNTVSLGKLRASLLKTRSKSVRNFLLACLSVSARKLSYADPRVSVPVRLNPDKPRYDSSRRESIKSRLHWIDSIDPITVFSDVVKQNIKRMESLFDEIGSNSHASIHLSDARELLTQQDTQLTCLKKNSVQLIITSPPYAGAQKYIRSSGLGLGWLGLAGGDDLRSLEKQSIGREHYIKSEYTSLKETGINDADAVLGEVFYRNPLRAHIAGNYLIEMQDACSNMINALKPGGCIVLVIGNNLVCGLEFVTKEYLKDIFLSLGASLILELVDDIHSRGLMTKRNKTANIISTESVLIFQK